MADIFGYLKRRGGISFEEDPFNEVDNLVLAVLSYTDFNGIVDDSFTKVDLETADREYFEKHSRRKARKSIFHFVRAPQFDDLTMLGIKWLGKTGIN